MPHTTEGRSSKPTDVCVTGATVYFLPVATRVPLKFGAETLHSVTCCRVRLEVRDQRGRTAAGWGETPLSVQWAWPADLTYAYRHEAMRRFALEATASLLAHPAIGHPLEIGHDFQATALLELRERFNQTLAGGALPYLAALICLSAADIALHDAFGNLHGIDVYQTYTAEFMSCDLAALIEPAPDARASFRGKYPADYFVAAPPRTLPVWHLVGGLDPLDEGDLASSHRVDDGYPEILGEWIQRDGLKCLKVKLCGTELEGDFERLARVARISFPLGVNHLSADFNCTVREPAYVSEFLDRLQRDHPAAYERLLYVEQPFPYDLDAHRIDVHGIARRKPLFLDESAHDWRHVQHGRVLGWNGVALKTCKTQTGSLLSLCWARAHGMQLMVQDLTNPMLAQIPHVRLAAYAGTIMGVESNAMQFYPEASLPEAAVHPGLYTRRNGQLDLGSLRGPGFGYRCEIARELPAPAAEFRAY